MKFRLTAFAAIAALGMAITPAESKTFRWAFQGDLQTMDPHGLFETMTLGFQRNIYEGLVIRNEKMEMVGALAESWKNIEPTVWRFNLRKGVKFHDGSSLGADDVAFSVKRLSTEGSDMKVVAALIKETRIVDEHTIDLVTPAPNPILPLQLEIFYIMDKQWAEKHKALEATNVKGGDEGNYANLNANGTGPFMLGARQSGVKTELVINPNYWGKVKGNITKAVFTPIAQDATRVAALISGNVHMAYPVPVQDWKRLDDAKGVKPLAGPEARTIFLGFDQLRDELLYSNIKGKNPFKDLRVRQAFIKAINIDAIKKICLKAILSDEPVPFGVDMGIDQSTKHGLMEHKLFDYESLFGIKIDLTKAQRKRLCAQRAGHMMAIIGVDIKKRVPQKWLIENSWGDDKGQKGLWTLFDSWFDEHVDHVIVHKRHIPAKTLKIFTEKPTRLPIWYWD